MARKFGVRAFPIKETYTRLQPFQFLIQPRCCWFYASRFIHSFTWKRHPNEILFAYCVHVCLCVCVWSFSDRVCMCMRECACLINYGFGCVWVCVRLRLHWAQLDKNTNPYQSHGLGKIPKCIQPNNNDKKTHECIKYSNHKIYVWAVWVTCDWIGGRLNFDVRLDDDARDTMRYDIISRKARKKTPIHKHIRDSSWWNWRIH